MSDSEDELPWSNETLMQTLRERDKYSSSFHLWRGICIAILVIVAFKTFSGREYRPEEGRNDVRLTIWSWWGLKTDTTYVRFGKQKGSTLNEWLVHDRDGDWSTLFMEVP